MFLLVYRPNAINYYELLVIKWFLCFLIKENQRKTDLNLEYVNFIRCRESTTPRKKGMLCMTLI